MILPIRLYTDKILHAPCQLITDFTELEALSQSMVETMLANCGVGLAANQVGLDKNIAVMYLENKTKILVLANMQLIRYTKETDTQTEGCLSCPGVSVPVTRSKGVEIEAHLLSGEKVQYQFTDYDARIFLHEYDHLQGRILSDNLKKFI